MVIINRKATNINLQTVKYQLYYGELILKITVENALDKITRHRLINQLKFYSISLSINSILTNITETL